MYIFPCVYAVFRSDALSLGLAYHARHILLPFPPSPGGSPQSIGSHTFLSASWNSNSSIGVDGRRSATGAGGGMVPNRQLLRFWSQPSNTVAAPAINFLDDAERPTRVLTDSATAAVTGENNAFESKSMDEVLLTAYNSSDVGSHGGGGGGGGGLGFRSERIVSTRHDQDDRNQKTKQVGATSGGNIKSRKTARGAGVGVMRAQQNESQGGETRFLVPPLQTPPLTPITSTALLTTSTRHIPPSFSTADDDEEVGI